MKRIIEEVDVTGKSKQELLQLVAKYLMREELISRIIITPNKLIVIYTEINGGKKIEKKTKFFNPSWSVHS